MIDEQIRDRLVREYLDKTNAALNDFDVALGNVSSDTSKASSEFSRLLAAFSVLRALGRGLETALLDITLQRLYEYLDDLQIAEQTIIASTELDKISGIDLACAIGATPLTHLPSFAVITSRDRDHDALRELTEASAVIQKGGKFGDDLADAPAEFDIL